MKGLRMQFFRIFALISMLLVNSVNLGIAQPKVDLLKLGVKDISECKALVNKFKGNVLGSQWIIGGVPKLFQLPNSMVTVATLQEPFEQVSCYGQIRNRVFVADSDGKYCGWIEKKALLADHQFRTNTNTIGTGEKVCPTPRAMTFADYCRKIDGLKFEDDDTCKNIPTGLRTKGVLLGTSDEDGNARSKFFTAPRNGQFRSDKPFFSVLEVHDVALGEDGDIMVLAGDGDGDIFGWINQQALKLWPTRLGLFYGASGDGVMFKSERNLIRNWRLGAPKPDVTAGVGGKTLYNYVHGKLQLLSYPIVKTVDPANDPEARADDTQYHEVIYLGQSGEGSATQVLSQAKIARKLANLDYLNIMIVMDTTESMVPYLDSVKVGIVNFISDYAKRTQDPSNKVPDTRISVVAYSDFLDPGKLGLTDPIKTETLFLARRVGPEYSIDRALENITRHKGLRDPVGKREEAALEAVFQLSKQFSEGERWAKGGYNLIIHVADHGSRNRVDIRKILVGMRQNNVDYIPVVILTDDKKDASRKRAREAFMKQAKAMVAPAFDKNAIVETEDIISVNLNNQKTSEKLTDALKTVVGELGEAKYKFREKIVGDDLVKSSSLVRDWASSRLKLDEKILRDRGLDKVEGKIIVRADTAFAPLTRKFSDGTRQLDWTYTVALERPQALKLRDRMNSVCRSIGRPDQKTRVRRLIISLAEMFSGDRVVTERDIIDIISDLAQLPGTSQSFLSQSPHKLLDLADSTDTTIIQNLKKDVCWLAYHLDNMAAEQYARPEQIKWYGSAWGMKPGEHLTSRVYRYKPLVGAETVYLPSFFFVQPSQVRIEEEASGKCQFFCDD